MAESEGSACSDPSARRQPKIQNKISGMWKPKSHFTHLEGQLALSHSHQNSVQESVGKAARKRFNSQLLILAEYGSCLDGHES